MTLLVPYDGSALSKAALERAVEFAAFMDAEVIVLSVLPEDGVEYALQRGWLNEDESYDPGTIRDRLEAEVADLAPAATFRFQQAADLAEQSTIEMDVVRTIRNVAAEVGAEIVFVGSENAGRVSTPVTSVGAPVSEDPRYDVHIVRHPE
ncbi:MAG: universal stress protein [Haloarculaceae archaeon]